MHGFKKDRFLRRVAVMCLGILVMGVGIGLFKVSLMGNDPSTALGIAVGDWMGIDFSVILIAMNCLYFVIESAGKAEDQHARPQQEQLLRKALRLPPSP